MELGHFIQHTNTEKYSSTLSNKMHFLFYGYHCNMLAMLLLGIDIIANLYTNFFPVQPVWFGNFIFFLSLALSVSFCTMTISCFMSHPPKNDFDSIQHLGITQNATNKKIKRIKQFIPLAQHTVFVSRLLLPHYFLSCCRS